MWGNSRWRTGPCLHTQHPFPLSFPLSSHPSTAKSLPLFYSPRRASHSSSLFVTPTPFSSIPLFPLKGSSLSSCCTLSPLYRFIYRVRFSLSVLYLFPSLVEFRPCCSLSFPSTLCGPARAGQPTADSKDRSIGKYLDLFVEVIVVSVDNGSFVGLVAFFNWWFHRLNF